MSSGAPGEVGAHPSYDGAVVDAHVHFDATTRDWAHALLATDRMTAVNLWDVTWPPPPFTSWRATWEAERPAGMALMHAPDLSRVGAPGFEDELVEGVRTAARLGAAGLKVWKNLGLTLRDVAGARLAIDDARLAALWQAAAEERLAVAIHVCDPPGFFAPVEPANERYAELVAHPEFWFGDRTRFPSREQLFEELERIVAAHPATTFVGLHFGCFMELAEVRRMLAAYPNYRVDTSARTFDLGRPAFRADALQVLAEFPERVIFGTDLSRTRAFDLPARAWVRGDLASFYRHHWRVFETTDDDIPAPFEFQPGDARLTGLGLDPAALRLLYRDNAVRTYRLGDTSPPPLSPSAARR